MRKLIVLVAMFALAAVASAQSAVTNRQPLMSFTVNPCNGEPVVLEGTCNYVTRTAGTSTTAHVSCHGNGIGAFGGEYGFGLNSLNQSDTAACNTTERFSERTRLITARSTQNAFITVTFLLTTDANCQPVVVVDQTEVDCKGKTGVF